ncbi:hypothetical protein [Gordonia araii]|uniref:hypothetical protein n=1 Tax=Gordonia araii TaxID=263909 RepID=UPI00147833F9|nr:hypothetical protein [Gordonia araii]NNG96562.1 hypothetical protein [Gordonia araii NBRC 100433]
MSTPRARTSFVAGRLRQVIAEDVVETLTAPPAGFVRFVRFVAAGNHQNSVMSAMT